MANSHAPALPASEVVKFHAVVGGRHQDALFGIAEMDNDRFVVVGTSSTDGFQGSGNKSFPFTTPANSLGCWQSLTNGYCVGVVLRFDASGTQLVLEGTNPIGRVSTETLSHHTVARDVVVHRKAVLDGTLDQFSVVGSTDDAQMFSWVPTSLTPQGILQGPSDGFLLTGWDQPGAGIVTFDQGWFQGDSGADGLTGVAIWNEYPDHIGALGFSQGVQSQTLDLEVASYFVDTPIPGALIPSLIRLRRQTQACPADQLPTEMGTVTATTPTSSVLNSSSAVIAVMLGLSYEENQLGSPAGGGVAIDQRGRVSVVGATTAVGFPVTGGGRQHASGIDAIRADYDMLPAGVGRTDGSGLDYTGLPVNIVATANGGTTPACMIAQFPFGSQLGMPTPPLKRMMIDYEGPAPGALVQANILVDRPPPGASIVGTFLNYGFPVGTGPIAPIPLAANPFAGTELWIDPSAWAYTLQFAPGEKSLRFPMAPMPPANTGNHRWSVQVINLLTVPVICPGTTSSLSFAASPMLVFSY